MKDTAVYSEIIAEQEYRVDELDAPATCAWPEPSFDVRPGGAVIELLTAMAANEWESRTLGRRWEIYHADANRFSKMWSWSLLNQQLCSHRAWPQRFRIVQRGADIPLSAYTEPVPGAHGPQPRVRVSGVDVRRLLLDGATLVFGAINEVLPDIQAIRNRLELAFHTDVTANLYAAWGSDDGFGWHQDPSDSWVLQLAGKKLWQIADPNGSKSMDVVVSPGDVLYVPLGWSHCVRAMGGETVHITFGVRHVNTRDMKQAHETDQLGNGHSGQVVYRPEEVNSAGSPVSLTKNLPSYWASTNARAPRLPYVDLPPRRFSFNGTEIFSSNLSREAPPCNSSDHVCIRAAGKRWVFSRSAGRLMASLFSATTNGWPAVELDSSVTCEEASALTALYENCLVRREAS